MSPNRINAALRLLPALLALALWPTTNAWCADAENSVRHYHPATAPGFDCNEADSPVQDFICASNTLAALDKESSELFRQQLRSADLFGRDQLLAGQRRWLTGRLTRCAVPAERQSADHPDANVSACLETSYRERLAELRKWLPATRSAKADSDHPVSAYLQFTTAEALDPALCARFQGQMNAAIKADGTINPARLPGAKPIAGGPNVILRDAGPYGSYELRATGLTIGGSTVLDENSLGRWIGEQPNFGGRPNTVSSQTNDYAAIDLFAQNGGQYALVSESWGYYTPAASGESAYAGLYSIEGGSVQRRCLFKTYLKPPVHSAFADLPAYNNLLAVLEAIRATEPSGLDVNDRRDEDLLRKEQDWQLLNLPLLQIIAARQFGWSNWLRRRHDITLDRLFLWSEGSLQAKQLYRALLPAVKPAMAEVVQTLQQTQGITAEEATQAADVLLMELFDHALGPIVDNGEAYAQLPTALATYKPRFPVQAERINLEKGRAIATLYGTVLNRMPATAVADFITWEGAHPDKRSFGRNGETALMAAVMVPDTVAQLLAAGADANEADRLGFTPLMLAARYGKSESVSMLLKAGANIEAQTLDQPTAPNEATEVRRARIGGKTALYFAAASGDAATIQTLLDGGAQNAQRDHYGALPCDAIKLNTQLTDDERTALTPRVCPPLPPPGVKIKSPVAATFADFAPVARPMLSVGDRWKQETRFKNTRALKESLDIVVSAVLPERIKLTINGSQGAMTPELGLLDGPSMHYDEGLQLLSFPLGMGKTWSFQTSWQHKGSGATGLLQLDITVKGMERIKRAGAAGGEIDAIRLEGQGLLHVRTPIRLIRRVNMSYWYAPSLRSIVRAEWNDGVEDTVTELVESSP